MDDERLRQQCEQTGNLLDVLNNPAVLEGGIHETTVGRIVRKIETILIQSGEFRLPGKKALHSTETEWNVPLIDVSESPSPSVQRSS